MTKSIIPFLLPLLFILSCVTAEKALNKGNNKEAVWKALSKLKKKPDDRKTRQVLEEAYPLFIEEYERAIVDLEKGYDPLKWEAIQKKYSTMEEAYKKIRAIPAARRTLPDVRSYAREVRDLEEKVLDARYTLGMEFLAEGDRENAKKAFNYFEFILDKRDRYKDVEDRLEEARDLATLFVGIAPIPIPSFRYQVSVIEFENQIAEELRQGNNDDFVRFIPPSNTRFPVDALDHIIEMRFADYSVGNTRDREQIYNRRREGGLTEERIVGDSTIVERLPAKAEVHCFTREIVSTGLLTLQILNQYDRRIEEQERFEGRYVYETNWGYYTGDQEALNSQDDNCLARRSPEREPNEQDLFVELTRPIYNDVTSFLERFYRRY